VDIYKTDQIGRYLQQSSGRSTDQQKDVEDFETYRLESSVPKRSNGACRFET